MPPRQPNDGGMPGKCRRDACRVRAGCRAKAAVMLPGLTEEQLELVVQYRDQGDAEISPIWVAQ